MNIANENPVIVGGLRVPFVKSFGLYERTTNQDMLTFVAQGLVKKYNLKDKQLGDVAFGGVMGYPSDWNLSREVVLGTELSPYTPGYNVQRACGTSLETSIQISLKIATGMIENGFAGGSDTNSDIPVVGRRELAWKLLDLRKAKSALDKAKMFASFSLKDLLPQFPQVVEPRTLLTMGQHCEKMVQEWGISREEQDQIALRSHLNAAHAYEEGFYNDLVLEFKGVKRDATVRGDTSIEKLAKLKPAFDFTGKGTLTAGNSSPLTDGAAAVLITSEKYARANGLPALARFVDSQVAAVDFVHGDGLLMGPTIAVSNLLKRNNMKLQDFDFYEIHEAFAGQVLCNLKSWESDEYCRKYLGVDKALGSINRDKMNVKGGSVAIGHPFGATGARIVASLAKILAHASKTQGTPTDGKPKRPVRGLISICTAGGMGVAAILESV